MLASNALNINHELLIKKLFLYEDQVYGVLLLKFRVY